MYIVFTVFLYLSIYRKGMRITTAFHNFLSVLHKTNMFLSLSPFFFNWLMMTIIPDIESGKAYNMNVLLTIFKTELSKLITIINSLVFSKLLYCSSVWTNTTKKNIELLQTVQNFAARIVSGTRKFDHVTPILKQLQWLPIVKQLEVRDATMVFKCLNGLAPPYLCQKFKTRLEVHNCNIRNRDRLHIPLCRMAAGQHAFTFRGQRLWNSLPDEFQSITNLDVFKVKIKQHFLRVFLEN